MINWRQIKIEYKKDLERIMCLPPKLSIFKKKNVRQLTQSLRTINRILFVRLQKRDGMAWISIFKPAPPVCVTKRFDPLWKWKLPLRSSRLASSGGNKNHGEAWQKPAQTGSVRVFGGEMTRFRSGARVRMVCVSRGCEQPLSPSSFLFHASLLKPNVHLRLAELRGPGDLGPPGPAQGLVEAELLLRLSQLPGVEASPRGHVDRVTVRAHAATEPTG